MPDKDERNVGLASGDGPVQSRAGAVRDVVVSVLLVALFFVVSPLLVEGLVTLVAACFGR